MPEASEMAKKRAASGSRGGDDRYQDELGSLLLKAGTLLCGAGSDDDGGEEALSQLKKSIESHLASMAAGGGAKKKEEKQEKRRKTSNGNRRKAAAAEDDDSEEVIMRMMRGKALLYLGQIDDMQGHAADAVKRYEEAMACGMADDPEALVLCAQALRSIAGSKEEMATVERHLREAVRLTTTRHDDEDEEDEEGNEEEGSLARLQLAQLLLHQQGGGTGKEEEVAGRREEADALLSSLGYAYRLADDLMGGPPQSPSPSSGGGLVLPKEVEGRAAGGSRPYVRVMDGALSDGLVSSLRGLFRDKGPFWREHKYESPRTGYFSYAVSLEEARSSPSPSLIEQAILQIYQQTAKLFPQVKSARVAEWWAHTRPHSCGHQLHFDTDEHRLHQGRGLHTPIISTVCYLRGVVGGPTVVLDHHVFPPAGGGGGGHQLAGEAVVVIPRERRLLAFEGDRLHGVLPGGGWSPDPTERRLTLMVGFWEEAEGRSFAEHGQGPMRTMPTQQQRLDWVREMTQERRAAVAAAAPTPQGTMATTTTTTTTTTTSTNEEEGVHVVSPCWVKIKSKGGGGDDGPRAATVPVKSSGRFFLCDAGEIDEEMEVMVQEGQRRAEARRLLAMVTKGEGGDDVKEGLEGLLAMVEEGRGGEEVGRGVAEARARWVKAERKVVVMAMKVMGAAVGEGGGGEEEVVRAVVEGVSGREGEKGGEVAQEAMSVLCAATGGGEEPGAEAARRVLGEEEEHGHGVDVVVKVMEGQRGAAREGAAAVLWNLGSRGGVAVEEGVVDRVMQVWEEEEAGRRKKGDEEEEEEVGVMMAGALSWLLVGEDGRAREGREADVRKVVEGGGSHALRRRMEQREQEDEEDEDGAGDDDDDEEEVAEALARLDKAYSLLLKKKKK